ncbi:hypothetical protein SCLCIDRAFT_21951 [Scleroderma citrinum Foug A]|uniref:CxC2-like cysteine cluster KDZ transposase-associated domain-containing protein n=1 Tax=Scleroderma citrinum Foug A TaxID=1036808 RepID=A0A0C3E114_9AGAM|nr:hypothetical protein SCLCIDRAFT_21951 [Scleroderma citrinum Foug A]
MGFTLHKWKADDMESTSTRHHTKIQLDSHGALRLTTETFTVPIPNPVPKTTTARQDVENHCQPLSYLEIPKCNDRLPPEVDLGVLDMEPRQLTGLDFPLLSWAKLDREDFLSELLRLEACPQPGKNTVLSSPMRDINALFVALDANFCLRCCVVSNNEINPSLSQGWGYFVEDTTFKAYLHDHKGNTQEKSTCSNHNAVNMADVKMKKGCDVTGVGMVVCARHGMRLLNGVADLQYGEHYVNMDYAFASALHHSDAMVLKVSYDIACQWHKNLYKRMDNMPSPLQLNLCDRDLMFLVPKFHLPTHILSCQWSFSFNWTKGVGQTDGEEPKRGWANLNAAASSTKDMGPGHHRDTLDDYLGDWNWKKLIRLGPSILRRIKEAIPERNDHLEDFEELTRSLGVKFPNQVAKWKRQVEEWESDSMKPNPFEIKNDGITQASIRLQLAKEEARLCVGEGVLPLHSDVTPSVLISTGIDLEEQQQCLCDISKREMCMTDAQQARFQQRTNLLMRRIEAWYQIQDLFMPGARTLRDEWTEFTSRLHSPEDVPLFLPLQIHGKAACPRQLEVIEFRLREGQAHNALSNLHQGLRSRAYILKFKDRFLHGQGANTRARNCLKTFDAKINAAATRYRVAYRTLFTLGPLLGQVGWKDQLQPLADGDICLLADTYDLRPGEGRRWVSWIWWVCGYGKQATEDESDNGFQEAIRVEWCKACARTHRWEEEVRLLFEEQQCTLRFLEWHVIWWMDRTNTIKTSDKALAEGHRAYAVHQAELWHRIGRSFAHVWRDTERFLDHADAHKPKRLSTS